MFDGHDAIQTCFECIYTVQDTFKGTLNTGICFVFKRTESVANK